MTTFIVEKLHHNTSQRDFCPCISGATLKKPISETEHQLISYDSHTQATIGQCNSNLGPLLDFKNKALKSSSWFDQSVLSKLSS
uniref:Uncharacterized protein n=1 Tax=Pygocentrus nattereri TaxID=42514 RepID=A0A3B4E2M9_PYGNA